MPVKAVILDVSGTLINGIGQIARGAPEMISRLRDRNVAVFLASNNRYRSDLIKRTFGIEESEILSPSKVGGKKGTGLFVDAVRSRLGIETNEILYLGDSDNDLREAVNRNIIFFLATWSNSTYQYGLRVKNPRTFTFIVETYFLKNDLWYYTVDDEDELHRPVVVRALLDPDRARDMGIRALLKEKKGARKLANHLTLHLIGSTYLEGLHLRGEHGPAIWCCYPGHDGAQTGVLATFAEVMTKLFRKKYEPTLIVRHRRAEKSAYARYQGRMLTIDNQLQSVHLDPRLREKIVGRHVLVIDDFTTHQHSFETARNFLFNAGAGGVISIAVGKYPSAYMARSPKSGVSWDSFAPASLTEDDFDKVHVEENWDVDALALFEPPPS